MCALPQSDSKIRPATGRKSAVPQCFQPARFSFLNWLEFCLVEKRIAPIAGRRSGHFEVVSGHFEVVRRQAATAARAPRAAAEGRPGHHQCPSHRRRGGSGADPPSAAARRRSSGRRQPCAEGATGPADARPAEPSSCMAGRAPPRRFSARWRAEEAAGVAAGIGGGASSVLGSEADFERRSIDLRAGRWVALGHRRRRGGRRRPEERLGRVAHMLPAK